MLIEIFKTDVVNELQANEIRELLLQRFPCSKINFDLHDCDKILRMEGNDFVADEVVCIVTKRGVACAVLD